MKKNKIYLMSFVLSCLFVAGCGIGGFTSSTEATSQSTLDPLIKYAWHIDNYGQSVFAQQPGVAGFDLNLTTTWIDQIYGNGVTIQISDDGLEDTHEDLNSNFSYTNQSKNYTTSAPYTANTSRPTMSDDNHGTCVAGLVAAVGWNGVGSRGVAPKAKLTIVNFLSSAVNITNALKLDQTQGSFDISNMSWGTTQDSVYTLSSAYNTQIKSMITSGRSGKGTIFVKSAGNDFAVECNGSSVICIGNSNFDADNALPYIITVGALNAEGESSSYSSGGANLWVSSFGGEFGDDYPAMLTADRSGCSQGYSNSSETASFEKGTNAENGNCNYTTTFNGTSSAAPVLSGVIALMLEANPALTWREVKYVLAKSASVDAYVVGSITHPIGGVTLPGAYVWEQRWITNAAGYKFHNWYGFGRADVDGAVALAKDAKTTPINLGTYTETNWNVADAHTGLNLAIPDNSAVGVTDVINVATNLKIEGVQIRVGITHADISELALELTSPSGTKSIIVNARNSLTGLSDYVEETFLSNAFYQESSVGNWTLKVVDAKAGTTGTVTSFKLNFVGGTP